MNKLNKMTEEDLVAAGFHRVENVQAKAPQISWGILYRNASLETQLTYAEKLAAAMNHAAHLIQEERNQLLELCSKKEEQIKSLKIALDQNNNMIQTQMTQWNAEKQQYNKSVADLKARIRELENDNNG